MTRKFIMPLIFLLSASISLFAQVEKGSKLLGVSFGSISFTNSDNKTTYSNTPVIYKSTGNSASIYVNPNIAWFLANKIAVGGSVSVGFYTSKSTSSNSGSSSSTENTSKQPSVYLGPFARFYFGGSSKGMPFAQVNLNIGVSGGNSKSVSSTGSSSETKTIPKSDYNAGVTFGYEHFISKYVGLYGSFGLNYGKTKTSYEYRPSSGNGYDYTSEYSRFYIPVNVGLQVHIPRGKK